MKMLGEKQQRFSMFSGSRYAVVINFQGVIRPSGSVEEGKKFLQWKHTLYDYETEVVVPPSGLAIGMLNHYITTVSDFKIS